jgi:hypothetical protein
LGFQYRGGRHCKLRLDNGTKRLNNRSNPMMDIVMLATGLGLFAATIAYAYACERL